MNTGETERIKENIYTITGDRRPIEQRKAYEGRGEALWKQVT